MSFAKGYTPWNKKEPKPLEYIQCACGCGEETEKFDARGRLKKYKYKHGNRGRKFPDLKHDRQFQKGSTPWNKGINVENEGTFKKGHKTNQGRKFPPEFGKRQSERQKGKPPFQSKENHWKWKGGITPENKLLRQKFRNEVVEVVFRRDNHTCQICLIRGGVLNVDHIKGWSEYPELRFDITNCVTLCKKCHYKKTFGKDMPEDSKWGGS